jgi:adenylate kinase
MSQQGSRSAWLQGPDSPCPKAVDAPARAYRMVLLGAPGVGKGTQAEFLCRDLKTCQLSTGDVFRAAKSLGEDKLSPAMKVALGHMQRGELVPDEIVVQMVRERLGCLNCEYGFLLDGFPRTVSQAESLEGMLAETGQKIDAVLSYELPMDEVIARLSGRRTCRNCKTTFHVATKPPKVEGVCDKCGGELYTREDDRPESIRVRLEAYETSTAPLADYYTKKGILHRISAEGSPEQVYDRTKSILAAL